MGKITDFNALRKANFEQLRVILADKSGIEVTFEEAEEVGIELVSLYECLAREHGSKEESQDGRNI